MRPPTTNQQDPAPGSPSERSAAAAPTLTAIARTDFATTGATLGAAIVSLGFPLLALFDQASPSLAVELLGACVLVAGLRVAMIRRAFAGKVVAGKVLWKWQFKDQAYLRYEYASHGKVHHATHLVYANSRVQRMSAGVPVTVTVDRSYAQLAFVRELFPGLPEPAPGPDRVAIAPADLE